MILCYSFLKFQQPLANAAILIWQLLAENENHWSELKSKIILAVCVCVCISLGLKNKTVRENKLQS